MQRSLDAEQEADLNQHATSTGRTATSGLQGFVFNGQREDGSDGLLASDPGVRTWVGGADPRREGIAMGTP